MLSIRINNNFLQIDKSTKYTSTFIHSSDNTDLFKKGYSYNINIPITPNNNRVLGFVNSGVLNDLPILKAQIFFNNLPIISGILSVEKVLRKVYNCRIKDESNEFVDKLKQKKINTLDLGIFNLTVPTGTKSGHRWRVYMNAERLKPIEQRVFAFPSIRTDASAYLEKGISFDSFLDKYSEMRGINYYIAGDYILNSELDKEVKKNWVTTYAPVVKVDYILKKIEAFFKIKFIFKNRVDIDYQKLFIFNNKVLDNYTNPSDTNSFGKWRNIGKDNFNLKNHVPEVSCYDLIAAISQMYNFSCSYDNGIITGISINELLVKSDIDISRKIVIKNTSLEYKKNVLGYIYPESDDKYTIQKDKVDLRKGLNDGEEYRLDKIYNINQSTATKKINLKYRPIGSAGGVENSSLEDDGGGGKYSFYIDPDKKNQAIWMGGVSDVDDKDTDSLGELVFGFYEEEDLIIRNKPAKYPNFKPLTSTFDLRFQDIYDKYYKNVDEFKNSGKLVNVKANLNIKNILDIEKQGIITITYNSNTFIGIVRKMTYSFSINGLSVVNLVVYIK